MPHASDLIGIENPATGEVFTWRDFAACQFTDPEIFFVEKGGSTKEAKSVCRSCEVRSHCLGYALDQGERFGVFGGLSERERRRLKRCAA